MTAIKYIISFIMLFIGISIGFWFGVERVYIDQESIPTKTTFDMLSIIASWLGAIGTLSALFFAMFIFKKWRQQVVDSHVLSTVIAILKLNVALKNSLSIFVLSGFDKGENNQELRQIRRIIDELEGEMEIFYAITLAKGDPMIWFLNSTFSSNDFLHATRTHKKIADQIVRFYLFNIIKMRDDGYLQFGVTYGAFKELRTSIELTEHEIINHSAIVDKNNYNATLDAISREAISSISKWL